MRKVDFQGYTVHDIGAYPEPPFQVFFDNNGVEKWRHEGFLPPEGFLPKEEIVKKLDELWDRLIIFLLRNHLPAVF